MTMVDEQTEATQDTPEVPDSVAVLEAQLVATKAALKAEKAKTRGKRGRQRSPETLDNMLTVEGGLSFETGVIGAELALTLGMDEKTVTKTLALLQKEGRARHAYTVGAHRWFRELPGTPDAA